jgi:hypothetical protein
MFDRFTLIEAVLLVPFAGLVTAAIAHISTLI